MLQKTEHVMFKYSTQPQSKMTKTSARKTMCIMSEWADASCFYPADLYFAFRWIADAVTFKNTYRADIRAENGQRGASSKIFNVV